MTVQILADYWRHTKTYSWLLVGLLLVTAAMQVAAVIAPLFLKQFIDVLSSSSAQTPASVEAMTASLLLFSFSVLISWVFRRLQLTGIVHLETRVMAQIDKASFRHLLGHSYHFFISNFAGSLTRKVARYKRAYETVADAVILQIFPTIVLTFGTIGVLFLRNHWLGIGLGVWAVVFVGAQFFFIRRLHPLRLEAAREDSVETGVLSDAIGNQSSVLLFSGRAHEESLFDSAVERVRKTTLRSWLADNLLWAVQGFLAAAIHIAMMWGAFLLWRKGLLTVGDFILIQAYLMTLFERLMHLGRDMRQLFTGFADASEMMEILEASHEVRDGKGAKALSVREGAFAFENVDFYFKKERPVLSKFNLSVSAREKVALVGPSGGGKSTITKLLLRFYEVSAGTVTIDGHSIAEATLESVRDAIAFVPQDPILFHRTLMENIRYGRRNATDAEVIEAARKAHCHEFIQTLEHGYNTLVGERGIKLSGGERQRIAIARAILKNAPILVLDEATSSLDSESESFIQDALEQFMKDKTVLVIAHRLSTIMKMDRIVVIEKGRVAASGAHNELLNSSPLYKKLWSIQAGGFIPETEEE